MSYYIGNIVQVEYKVESAPSIFCYYKIKSILFVNEQPLYVLRHADDSLDRDIHSTLHSTETVIYRKVDYGSDKGNGYPG